MIPVRAPMKSFSTPRHSLATSASGIPAALE